MKIPHSALFLSLIFAYSLPKSSAQPTYTGARVAVFDIHILQQKPPSLTLRCRLANTGRQPLGGKAAAADMQVEFDTLGLPALLRGHEAEIAAALRGNCPKLKPGELSEPIWLTVKTATQAWPSTSGCADMVFDTAFVEEWGARTMRIRYFLQNKGTAPAHFFAKKAEPSLNLYFVSGAKLTRGAIPAGNTRIQKGRETLDGVLLPGQTIEGSVEIPLKDRSKFSPNIALEFDPAQAVDECGRNGNVWVICLRY